LSDVKIRQIHDGKITEYYGHKAILCGHSGWFMTALNGAFMVNPVPVTLENQNLTRSLQEATKPIIEIYDDDPDLFALMLKFLYIVELPHEHKKGLIHDLSEMDDFIDLIQLHALAEKYDAVLLQKACVGAFKSATNRLTARVYHSHAEILVHAHYSQRVKSTCLMGEAVFGLLLRIDASILVSPEFERLVQQYSILATEFYVYTRLANRLYIG
jgi:hypothetical protein